uniref:thiol oxidase n=1 Tax=viral metagenome TaxID=1070528 RepID=A0A6C0HI20_9ZZZZ
MFSKPRSTLPPSIRSDNISMMNILSLSRMQRNAQSTFTPAPVQTIKEIPEDPSKKKMKWGEPIWFFFHTIAEKVKPESFSSIRMELLQIITNICKNLPCPYCSQHAITYLANTNINNIQTKEQLIEFFYTFHNEVNQRKGFDLFPRELLHDKYSKANTVNIINYFLIHLLDKSYSIRMIADDFHRKRLVEHIKKWLINNLQHFDS